MSTGAAVAATGGMATSAFVFYYGGNYADYNQNKDKSDDSCS